MNRRERQLENAVLAGIVKELWSMLERRTDDDECSDKLHFALEDAARCIARTHDLLEEEFFEGDADADSEFDEAVG